MSADSQTLQAKYQKLAAEFSKVCKAYTSMLFQNEFINCSLLKLHLSAKLKILPVSTYTALSNQKS